MDSRAEMQMNKAKLLEEMRSARWNWELVLAQVDVRRVQEPTMHGGWSVRDTVGHVAYYERWLLNWLEDAVRGRVRAATYRELLSVEERNALVYAENKDRDLEEILAESRQVSERLYSLVQTLPELDLLDPYRFDRYIEPIWGESRPLWKCIAGDSYSHYAEHTANIREWLVVNGAHTVVGLGSLP
jgi:uncharacterized damage-inducible protein DinB